MKIYFAHSTHSDFRNNYYKPIKESVIADSNLLIFPHESDDWLNSKEVIKGCDFVVAEVSQPSTALGIEMGWANAFSVPILCVNKRGSEVSVSLKAVTDKVVVYDNNLANVILENLS